MTVKKKAKKPYHKSASEDKRLALKYFEHEALGKQKNAEIAKKLIKKELFSKKLSKSKIKKKHNLEASKESLRNTKDIKEDKALRKQSSLKELPVYSFNSVIDKAECLARINSIMLDLKREKGIKFSQSQNTSFKLEFNESPTIPKQITRENDVVKLNPNNELNKDFNKLDNKESKEDNKECTEIVGFEFEVKEEVQIEEISTAKSMLNERVIPVIKDKSEEVLKNDIMKSVEEISKTDNESRRIQETEKEIKANYDKMLSDLEAKELTTEEYERKRAVIALLYRKKANTLKEAKRKVISETLTKIISLMDNEENLSNRNIQSTIKTSLELIKEMITICPLDESSSSIIDDNIINKETTQFNNNSLKEKPNLLNEQSTEKAINPNHLIEQSKLNDNSEDLATLFKNFIKATDESQAIATRTEVIDEEAQAVLNEKEQPKGIRTDLCSVDLYLEEIFKEILKDAELFVISLSIPLSRDPLFILGQIQNESSDYYKAEKQAITKPILPIDLYFYLERNRAINPIEPPINEQHEMQQIEWSNIHNKAIFDALNDALDFYRPYELKGPPVPWSMKIRKLTYKNGSVSSAQTALLQAKLKVLSWASVKAGILKTSFNPEARERINLEKIRNEKIELFVLDEVNALIIIGGRDRINMDRL